MHVTVDGETSREILPTFSPADTTLFRLRQRDGLKDLLSLQVLVAFVAATMLAYQRAMRFQYVDHPRDTTNIMAKKRFQLKTHYSVMTTKQFHIAQLIKILLSLTTA